MHRSISRFKRVVFSFAATLMLLVGAEAVVRARYFFLHHHDWNYITMPFRVHDTQSMDHAFYIAPTGSRLSGVASGEVSAGSPGSTPASSDQMNFTWLRPCRDREVFSEHYQKPMPYTWDANCFRGDPVSPAKPPGEIRLFVLGGSTVEDAQPDVDTWTAQLKTQLGDPRVKVVNAGQTAMGSASVAALYDKKILRAGRGALLRSLERAGAVLAGASRRRARRSVDKQHAQGSSLSLCHVHVPG
jgi:hypothetical protein